MLQLISPDDTISNPSEFGIFMQNHPNNAMLRVQMSYSVQISYTINEVKQAQILATPRSRKHSLHPLHCLKTWYNQVAIHPISRANSQTSIPCHIKEPNQ